MKFHILICYHHILYHIKIIIVVICLFKPKVGLYSEYKGYHIFFIIF